MHWMCKSGITGVSVDVDGDGLRLTEARMDHGEWEIWSSGNIARSVAFR